MSLSFRSAQIAAPSIAPASSTSGGTYYVVHRRVNLDGGVTIWSQAITDVALPATITPQSYGDTSQLLRDEILISEDSGATYRIVPRPTSETGALAIASFDGTWTIGTDGDTQNSVLSTLDFGSFSALSSPARTFFLYNQAQSQGSLTFNFLDAATNEIASDYSGLILVELLGTIGEKGQNYTTTYNGSFLWVTPGQGLNTLALILPNKGLAKFRVTLSNFPTGGLASNTVQLSAQVVGNQKRFPLGYGVSWANHTFLYDPNLGFDFPIVTSSNGSSITIAPFLFNYNGILVGQFSAITLTLSNGAGDYTLTVTPQGTLQAWHSTETVPTNTFTLATLTTSATPAYLSTITYSAGLKPQTSGQVTEPGSNMFGRFITIDSNNDPQLESANPIGIYVGNGYYASGGTVLVETQATVAVGDRLGPTTSGYAALDATGVLMARSSDFFGFVIADFYGPIGSLINGVAVFYETTKPTTRKDGSALVAGDRWYKTDDGTEWFWNGTYWLSLETYSVHSFDFPLLGGNTAVWGGVFPHADKKIFVTRQYAFGRFIPSIAGDKWVIQHAFRDTADTEPLGALPSLDFTAPDTATYAYHVFDDVNTVYDLPANNIKIIYVSIAKTGASSAFSGSAGLDYRLVA